MGASCIVEMLHRRSRSFLHVARCLYRGWVDDSLGDTAAALTYYGILSVFPCLLFVVALFGLLLDPQSISALVDAVARSSPKMAADLVRERLVAIQHTSSRLLVAVGLTGTLVGTTEAVVTLMQALNRCYGVRETRRFWRRWGLAVLATVVAGVTGVLALSVAFVGPLVAAHVSGPLGVAVRWARLPIAALLVTALWAFVYWALPNVKTGFRLFTPGALIGALLWIAASAALNAYVRWSRTYEITYGALGGVIVMLLWMWLSSSALLIGAEINKVLTSAEQLRCAETGEARQGKQPTQAATPRTTDSPPGIPG
jgi:membrane protein